MISPRSTPETLEWLQAAAARGALYPSLCLKLAREARGIPPMFASALSAAAATPEEHRVYRQGNWARGMVAYFDAPSDSNPFGHIATLAFRGKDDVWRAWSNVDSRGRIALVPITLFTQGWGDPIQFAARWLNGYELDLPLSERERERRRLERERRRAAREAAEEEHAEAVIREALSSLLREASYQERRKNEGRARALRRDVAILRRRHERLLRGGN